MGSRIKRQWTVNKDEFVALINFLIDKLKTLMFWILIITMISIGLVSCEIYRHTS